MLLFCSANNVNMLAQYASEVHGPTYWAALGGGNHNLTDSYTDTLPLMGGCGL